MMKKKMMILPALLLAFGVLMSMNAQAQLILENNTNCTYKVKVNTVPAGWCGINGAGPVFNSPAGITRTITWTPPAGTWVSAFGVNEMNPLVLPPVIVGGCGGFPPIVGPYGSCVTQVIWVGPNHLRLN